MPPDRGLSRVKMSGVKGKKTRITYAFTVNADGSDILDPLIIGKYKKPRAFHNKTGTELGFLYRNNAKAWMTSVIFEEWLSTWDRDLQRQNRKIQLWLDNFSGHTVPENGAIKMINVQFFKANLTSHVQPLDAGIIRAFKAHYRSAFMARAVGNFDRGVPAAQVYEINQLEAMRMAEIAWRKLTPATIQGCWRKAGILSTPSNNPQPMLADPTALITAIEKQVAADLDALINCGLLTKLNQMTIDELLNPPEEAALEVCEIEEIVAAVKDAHQPEVMGTVDEEPLPSRKEVLQAAELIQRYLRLEDGKFAWTLEAGLAELGRKTWREHVLSMKPTQITSYFTRKI
jgi:hypothetical protein